jgi:hypothetical protein
LYAVKNSVIFMPAYLYEYTKIISKNQVADSH